MASDIDRQISVLNDQKNRIRQEAEKKKKNIDLEINRLKKKKLDQQRQEIERRKIESSFYSG